MTREEFIEVLEDLGYAYEIEGDKIIVTHRGNVNLILLETIPRGVVFNSGDVVYLYHLKTIPSDTKFNNRGVVNLGSLKTLPSGMEFNNGEGINLASLKTIPPIVMFNNGGGVYLSSLIGGWFKDWNGNIEGIASKRLLNSMISKGMFI